MMSNLALKLSLLYLKVMVGMPDSHVQKIHQDLLQVFNKIYIDLRKVDNCSSERITSTVSFAGGQLKRGNLFHLIGSLIG